MELDGRFVEKAGGRETERKWESQTRAISPRLNNFGLSWEGGGGD